MQENLNSRRENLNPDVKLIKDVMNLLGLNQKEIAQKVGRTEGSVSQWMNGHCSISRKPRKILEDLLSLAEKEKIDVPNKIEIKNDRIEQSDASSIVIRFPNEHGQTVELNIKGSVVMTIKNVPYKE